MEAEVRAELKQLNMLLHNYYTILQQSQESDAYLFEVSLNADCSVYKGHFPGEPVSPGVCNIQMLKECLETILGHTVLLDTIQQCRFTTLITPVAYPVLEIRIYILQQEEGRVKFKATIGKGEEVYLELKAEAALS